MLKSQRLRLLFIYVSELRCGCSHSVIELQASVSKESKDKGK